jgi:hypothetical protein
MPAVIIGHTTESATKIWVRGDRWYPSVSVTVAAGKDAGYTQGARLRGRDDYTRVFDFPENSAGPQLTPATAYTVCARFQRPWWWLIAALLPRKVETGHFRTAPPTSAGDASFSFLLGSCNLSNTKINNLIGMVSGMAGFFVAQRSLRRPSNEVEGETFLWTWFKNAVAFLTKYWAMFLYLLTKQFRQPAPPLAISPFVRLSALLGAWQLRFVDGEAKPAVGTTVVGEVSGATGIVVFQPVVNNERRWQSPGVAGGDARGRPGARGHLTIVRTNDTPFKSRVYDKEYDECDAERLLVADNDMSGRKPPKNMRRRIATVVDAALLEPEEGDRVPPPSFMVHAGDQIYFDFPLPEKPKKKHYRYAYREAWIEDRVASHFLRQCPQYMTLDDHEIFNDFANDAAPPDRSRPKDSAEEPSIWSRLIDWLLRRYKMYPAHDYAHAAIGAYREYVHGRHPALGDRQSLGDDEPLYYAFNYGTGAHFFVLDTRTERYKGEHHEGQMISNTQLEHLKAWLSKHKDQLLFIVSSVPFVPELLSSADEGRVEQDPEGLAITRPRATSAQRERAEAGARTADKWSARAFARQREAIIRHIHEQDIQRVVFLTGDMHCCYHATMTVRTIQTSVTIHELAAGPIYQLRYGQQTDFLEQYRGAIETEGEALEYRSRVLQFYGLANAVLQIDVQAPASPHRVAGAGHNPRAAREQTLAWRALHTIAEPPPKPGTSELRAERPVMSGKIHFSYTS